ncbi:MAG: hypothetical protein AAGB16_04975 [Pseudomonadota bacterium]
MSKLFLLLAAGLTMAILFAHIVLGGSLVVPPLLGAEDLPETAAWLAYFNWHVGSVALAVCAGALVFSVLRPQHGAVAVFAALILTGFGLLGLGMAIFGNPILWGTPAPYAFGVIALLAWIGIFTRPKTGV